MAAYDATDVNVSISGRIVTGFAEGSIVECSRNEDRITPYIGTKGETAYSINNNNTGTITINLQQQSPINAVLQGYANRKESFSISVIDINAGGGNFRAGGNEAYIVTDPTYTRSDAIETQTWEIYVFDYTMVAS